MELSDCVRQNLYYHSKDSINPTAHGRDYHAFAVSDQCFVRDAVASVVSHRSGDVVDDGSCDHAWLVSLGRNWCQLPHHHALLSHDTALGSDDVAVVPPSFVSSGSKILAGG